MKDLLKINWKTTLDGQTLDDMWEYFKERVKEAEEICIPCRTTAGNGNTRVYHTLKLDASSLNRIKNKHKL